MGLEISCLGCSKKEEAKKEQKKNEQNSQPKEPEKKEDQRQENKKEQNILLETNIEPEKNEDQKHEDKKEEDIIIETKKEPEINENQNQENKKEEDILQSIPDVKKDNIGPIPIINVKNSFNESDLNVSISADVFGIGKEAMIAKNMSDPKKIYDIGKVIGKGRHGIVYSAVHKETKNKCAIKCIRKAVTDNVKELDDELDKEINLLRSLDHQNILKIFEFFEGKKNYYIVTELLDGGSLKDKLSKGGTFTEVEAGLIMFQLLSAINYCHSLKVMHRDLKLENVLFENTTKNGMIYAKIIDFGTAKFYEGTQTEKFKVVSDFYKAPEVFYGRYTEKCDVWSLGVILYALLTNNFPYTIKDNKNFLSQMKSQDMKLDAFKISEEAKDLIKKLLQFFPEERLTAAEALEHIWFKKNKIIEKLSELPVEKINALLNNINNYHPDKFLQQATLAYLVHNNPQLKEIQEARALYLKIDLNNDGHITYQEFSEGIKSLFKEQGQNISENHIVELFNIIDADHSNDIEYEEFARAACDRSKFMEESILKNAFDYFDKKKQGKISLNDFKEIFKKNQNFSDDDFKEIIDEVDQNGDGVIDMDEFKHMMSKILC